MCGHSRSRKVEACEEIGNFVEMVELSPSRLHQLPSPIESNQQQEGCLEIASKFRKACAAFDQSFHRASIRCLVSVRAANGREVTNNASCQERFSQRRWFILE